MYTVTKWMNTSLNCFLILLAFGIVGLFLWRPDVLTMWKPTDAQIAERRKPKIVHEIDGCQIYKFQDEKDEYRYFTRCGDKVTMEKNT